MLLLNGLFLYIGSGWAAATPVNLNDFFADPTVTVDASGFSANMAEDSGLSMVLLSNDPGLGDPNIILPDINTSLFFDYNFIEASGENDQFTAFLIDASTGGSISGFDFFIENSGSGTVEFDLSSLTGQTLGLQFELAALFGDTGLGSVVTVSDVRLESSVSSVPESSILLLLFVAMTGLIRANFRVSDSSRIKSIS